MAGKTQRSCQEQEQGRWSLQLGTTWELPIQPALETVSRIQHPFSVLELCCGHINWIVWKFIFVLAFYDTLQSVAGGQISDTRSLSAGLLFLFLFLRLLRIVSDFECTLLWANPQNGSENWLKVRRPMRNLK